MKFNTPIPPSVNEYLGKRVGRNPVTKKPIVICYETEKAKRYKRQVINTIKRVAKEEGWEKTGEYEYLICEIVAYIPQKKQDTDNMFKCLLDAIKDSDVCYDDSMIIPRVKDVFIDSSNPRVEVDLHKSCKQGIFKNATIKKSFIESNCKNCSRMSRNCSLLKKSLENRIQPEISIKNNLCTSYKEKRS